MHAPSEIQTVTRHLLAGLGATVLCVFSLSAAAQTPVKPVSSSDTANAACPTILNRTFARLQDDVPQNLCQYTGKVLLVVNTASYCGFTSQYEGLEKLYADLGPKGLVVLGFPSNDFGKQEPGDSKQIADFCFNTYGVKFPMFEKTVVKGAGANALYSDLLKTTGRAPGWNFYKYLIDRKGKVVGTYSSMTTPDSNSLLTDIKRALADI
jgi:glutathione peroxidase